MDELNATMNDPARPWHRKALDAIKIIPQVGGAFLAGGPTAALTKAITATAAQFFVEVAAKGGSAETQRLDVPSSASTVSRQPLLTRARPRCGVRKRLAAGVVQLKPGTELKVASILLFEREDCTLKAW